MPGGKKLAVVFYGGGDGEKPGNFISWRESKDGGVSWSDPVPAVVPMDMERQRVFDPCLWL
ncbi:MAG: sialidase family protein, partial [Lentisphaeria bacterium]|nr:sialidase family protein [Lentisphaeria bacterium]